MLQAPVINPNKQWNHIAHFTFNKYTHKFVTCYYFNCALWSPKATIFANFLAIFSLPPKNQYRKNAPRLCCNTLTSSAFGDIKQYSLGFQGEGMCTVLSILCLQLDKVGSMSNSPPCLTPSDVTLIFVVGVKYESSGLTCFWCSSPPCLTPSDVTLIFVVGVKYESSGLTCFWCSNLKSLSPYRYKNDGCIVVV
jgi:hypothetical protein